jgi:hypothetical protein
MHKPGSHGTIQWIYPFQTHQAHRLTSLLTEMRPRNRRKSFRNQTGGRSVKLTKLTAICEPTVYTLWDPQHLTTLWAYRASYRNSFTFLYVDDVPTSQKTYLWAYRASYRNIFTFLYVDDVPTSQKTYLKTSTACYGVSFTYLYVDDVRTSQKIYLWASTACYGVNFTYLYVDDVRTSQEIRLWASTTCYGDMFAFPCLHDVRTSQEARQWVSKACYRDSFTFYFYYVTLWSTVDSVLWIRQINLMVCNGFQRRLCQVFLPDSDIIEQTDLHVSVCEVPSPVLVLYSFLVLYAFLISRGVVLHRTVEYMG